MKPTPHRRLPAVRLTAGLFLAGFAGLGLSCGGAPVLASAALEIGRNLLSTTTKNYTGDYSQQVEEVLNSLVVQPVEGQVAGLANPAPAASLTPQARPLALDVSVTKEISRGGQQVPTPISDGEVLRDGGADPQGGDNFKIQFRPAQECYIYVISVDGTGWAQPLFPSSFSSASNPVSAGQAIVIPGGSDWFYLDQYKGVETIWFLVSRTRRTDLESQMQALAGRSRPAFPPDQQIASVKKPAIVERGIAGTRPSRVPASLVSSAGLTYNVTPTTFSADSVQADLVLTRWFRHE